MLCGRRLAVLCVVPVVEAGRDDQQAQQRQHPCNRARHQAAPGCIAPCDDINRISLAGIESSSGGCLQSRPCLRS